MSRDFILILGGGVVSLLTTLVVLFASDYIFRRDELLYRKSLPPPPIFTNPASDAMDESEMFAEDNAVVIAEEGSDEHDHTTVTTSEPKFET